MAKFCNLCGKEIVFPDVFTCAYCYSTFCPEHRLAEDHNCPPAIAAGHIEKHHSRKKGQNITKGHYRVVCKNCGFTSAEAWLIVKAEEELMSHMKSEGCPEEKIVLRQDEEEVKAEQKLQKTEESPKGSACPKWMYDRLKDAQNIINTHHRDESDFFSEVQFNLFIQGDKRDSYGYIDGIKPYYRIGIHEALFVDTPENQRMVTIVLVHELLHAIHVDWGHDKVNPEQRRLANLGNYFDALRNMEVLYLSGRMRLCDR